MDHCYGCMEPIGAEDQFCSMCGFSAAQYQPDSHHLCPGTRLRDRYIIGKVLGSGGFGITYIGWDVLMEEKVAIKEFYMDGYVIRDHTLSNDIRLSGTNGEVFKKNRDKAMQEAKTLAKFKHEPGVVNVRDLFQEHNTTYIVMEFLDGETLREYVEKHGKLSGPQVLRILEPVFRSLANVHESGLIHRDISPDNIMLLKTGEVKLLDFGATREASEQASKSLSVILKPGYAPFEQYQRRGKQGPWTDVYALCATMYRCITGVTPDGAMDRIAGDCVVAPVELDCDCSKAMSDVLMRGLRLYPEERYQTVSELWAAMTVQDKTVWADPEKTVNPEPKRPEPPAPPAPPKKKKKWLLPLGAVVILAVVLAVVFGSRGDFTPAEDTPDDLIQMEAQAVETEQEPVQEPDAVEPTDTEPEQDSEPVDAGAQYTFGNQYYFGDGVEQDYEQAVYWYRKAAEQGYAAAQYNLGVCYHSGTGVEPDLTQAVEWYQLAAEQGHDSAQTVLGQCYYFGTGTEQDYEQAVEWYQLAAEQGNAAAQCGLAYCYYTGDGVEQDYTQAVEWYRLAAKHGNADAQYGLGCCYEYGAGVEQDSEQAKYWWEKAAEQGNTGAQDALETYGY